jgi:hypothetical protein
MKAKERKRDDHIDDSGTFIRKRWTPKQIERKDKSQS